MAYDASWRPANNKRGRIYRPGNTRCAHLRSSYRRPSRPDENTYHREEEFIFGEQILVNPISQPNTNSEMTYLPHGKWFDFWTDTVYDGQQTIKTEVTLEQIPIFIKAGSIIPMYPVMQYTQEKPIDLLTLHIYYKKGVATSQLYEDSGEGYAYKNENYRIKTFEYRANANALMITQIQQGHYQPSYQHTRLIFHGIPEIIMLCIKYTVNL